MVKNTTKDCNCKKTIRKAGNDIRVHTLLSSGIKYEHTDRRIRTCQNCENNTWMTKVEYLIWLKSYGAELFTNFAQLVNLPLLPKYELSKTRRCIFCRISKCFIPAKARVAKEKCPKNKW